MPVVPLTVIASLCLVFTFVVFFLRMHRAGRLSCAERDALLPFAAEGRRPVDDGSPRKTDDIAQGTPRRS
jgi:hypothetical protein